MADTIESLRAELNKLRAEFNEFKTYAKPVIDGHQPLPIPMPPPIPLMPPFRPPGVA